jgi:protein-S-isoprenylcysteine O-methyltransferase Ste14
MLRAPAVLPSPDLPLAVRAFAGIAFFVAGLAVILAGTISIRRARTTINPTKQDSASTLVTSGIYSHKETPCNWVSCWHSSAGRPS